MNDIDLKAIKRAERKAKKRLISRGWIYNEEKNYSKQWSLPKTVYKDLCFSSAMDEDDSLLLKELGYKKCYELSVSKSRYHKDVICCRKIHPVSGRVYRWTDAICIAREYNNNDEEFYKSAEHWSKLVNIMLEKESATVRENDIFACDFVKNIKNLELHLTLRPRPIEWKDLTKELQEIPYWKEKFGE